MIIISYRRPNRCHLWIVKSTFPTRHKRRRDHVWCAWQPRSRRLLATAGLDCCQRLAFSGKVITSPLRYDAFYLSDKRDKSRLKCIDTAEYIFMCDVSNLIHTWRKILIHRAYSHDVPGRFRLRDVGIPFEFMRNISGHFMCDVSGCPMPSYL